MILAVWRLLGGSSVSPVQNADPTVVGVTAGVAVAAGAAPISNLSPADDGAGDVSDTVMVLHEILVTVALALMVIW